MDNVGHFLDLVGMHCWHPVATAPGSEFVGPGKAI